MRTRRVRSIAVWCAVSATLASTACDETEVESWLQKPGDPAPLYREKPYGAAMGTLMQKVPSPVRALSLVVYPDRIVLQAQNPKEPSKVDQYVYRGGQVGGPVSVKLMGTGQLDDNLFPLATARLETVPNLIPAARKKAQMPHAKVERVLLKRNLPESMDIQFRVFLTDDRRDARVDADKDGKMLD